jgi:CRP-like cAMP-binding protein
MSKISRVTYSFIPVIEEPPEAVIERVAGVLLDYARDNTIGKPGLSQREIALKTGASWEQVHESLGYLQREGTIRIERSRIIIEEAKLRRIAGPVCEAC